MNEKSLADLGRIHPMKRVAFCLCTGLFLVGASLNEIMLAAGYVYLCTGLLMMRGENSAFRKCLTASAGGLLFSLLTIVFRGSIFNAMYPWYPFLKAAALAIRLTVLTLLIISSGKGSRLLWILAVGGIVQMFFSGIRTVPVCLLFLLAEPLLLIPFRRSLMRYDVTLTLLPWSYGKILTAGLLAILAFVAVPSYCLNRYPAYYAEGSPVSEISEAWETAAQTEEFIMHDGRLRIEEKLIRMDAHEWMVRDTFTWLQGPAERSFEIVRLEVGSSAHGGVANLRDADCTIFFESDGVLCTGRPYAFDSSTLTWHFSLPAQAGNVSGIITAVFTNTAEYDRPLLENILTYTHGGRGFMYPFLPELRGGSHTVQGIALFNE